MCCGDAGNRSLQLQYRFRIVLAYGSVRYTQPFRFPDASQAVGSLISTNRKSPLTRAFLCLWRCWESNPGAIDIRRTTLQRYQTLFHEVDLMIVIQKVWKTHNHDLMNSRTEVRSFNPLHPSYYANIIVRIPMKWRLSLNESECEVLLSEIRRNGWFCI